MQKLKILLFMLMIICIVAYEQHDYTIRIERANVDYFNSDYLENARYYVSKFNRTSKGINMKLTLKVPVTRLRTHVTTFKFLSNEYRPFPITFNFNFCQYLRNDTFGLQDLVRQGNFTNCPLKKGTYQINNWMPNHSKYPPRLIFGQFMMQEKFMIGSIEWLTIRIYGIVHEIVKMEKRWN